MLLVVLAGIAGAAGPVGAVDDGFVVIDPGVAPTQPTPTDNFTVATTVANTDRSDPTYVVRSVTVYNGTDLTAADRLNGVDPDRSIEPGESATVNVSTALESIGTHDLLVELHLESVSGEWATVRRPLSVRVRQPHPRVSVRGGETVPGSPAPLNVTVSNGMDDPVRDVELRVAPENVTVESDRQVVSRMAAGEDRRFNLTARGPTRGTETIEARLAYTTTDGVRRSTTEHLTARFVRPTNPANVSLTGLEVSRRAGGLLVRGTAGNPGGSEAGSVQVSVGRGDGVAPAQSNANYFVGSLAASDFSSFTVSARLTENRSQLTIPLRVSYVVEGVERTRTVAVAYDPPPRPSPSGGNGPPIPLVAGGGLLAVAVAGVGVWRWFGGDR
jgi:hypothetical protein